MSEYRTTDLNLAAFLVARGHGLLRVTPMPGSHQRAFCFAPGTKSEADEYYQGAQVGARTFANALRDLKARIRET